MPADQTPHPNTLLNARSKCSIKRLVKRLIKRSINRLIQTPQNTCISITLTFVSESPAGVAFFVPVSEHVCPRFSAYLSSFQRVFVLVSDVFVPVSDVFVPVSRIWMRISTNFDTDPRFVLVLSALSSFYVQQVILAVSAYGRGKGLSAQKAHKQGVFRHKESNADPVSGRRGRMAKNGDTDTKWCLRRPAQE